MVIFYEKNKSKGFNVDKDNNNEDTYGYDFVPTISHWTNIDEQRKEVNYLENIGKVRKNTNNDENGQRIDII